MPESLSLPQVTQITERRIDCHQYKPPMAEPVQASHQRRLTLFGRSILLISGVFIANVVCWVIAGFTFRDTGLISLCLLAWVGQSFYLDR